MSKHVPETPEWYTSGLVHTWLPYCQMQRATPPLAATATESCRIRFADGSELIDGISSWWTACHGYNHPHIVQAMQKQLEVMPHVMFGGLVHEPALRLAERLTRIVPPGLTRVFFTDSGSIAVEVAMKMALQYWRNKGMARKERFLCFTNGYHGDTFGAMSVSDPEKSMHKAFRRAVIPQYVVDIPTDEYSFAEFDTLLSGIQKDLVGIIIEPLVQGAGGMRFHSADVLAELFRIAKKYDLLFIADEIATGFGRTGNMFACAEAGITPDIMTIGKALTGGTISLGATLAREEVFSAFLSDSWENALMHGPTYMANPLACAAANASLDLFEQEPRLQQVETIEWQLRDEMEPCRGMNGVIDVRVKGAIGVVQLSPEIDIYALRPKFAPHGVWVRPFKDVVYLTPPFVISPEELTALTQAVRAVIAE
jgi:adenosylmethionine---8-amino-7-oxononanoate aminotransferase